MFYFWKEALAGAAIGTVASLFISRVIYVIIIAIVQHSGGVG
jgi:Na+-driven multidrug efflux pump